MLVNVREYLLESLTDLSLPESGLQLPDVRVDTSRIKCIMINEVPPVDPHDGFYSVRADADYMKTTRALFEGAGVHVADIRDILELGIYITTAVKTPKDAYAVSTEAITGHLPLLEKEIGLFPELKVIMLMGDVAKKAFNLIAKKRTGKGVIPSAPTYKIRNGSFYYDGIRVFPSYIMTGGNILIEKSKRSMISEDIRHMMDIISEK